MKIFFAVILSIILLIVGAMGYIWYGVTDGGETIFFADKSISRDGIETKIPEIEPVIAGKLATAISQGDIAEVKELLSKGVNLNAHFYNERTPLLMAIDGSYTKKGYEMVNFLLQNGADPELRDDRGNTAIIKALGLNRSKAAAIIMKYKPNLFAANDYGYSPIGLASKNNEIALVKEMLKRGVPADYRHKNQWGAYFSLTPLMQATFRNHIEMINLLLDNGADISIRSKKGFSALDFAEYKKYDKAIDTIKNHSL